MTRYAIYAAPERDTRLWHFGNRVLGRDAETGEAVAQIVPEGFQPGEWQDFTASPRRYGFHATLKAPFHLAAGKTEYDLRQAVRAFGKRGAAIAELNLAAKLSGDYVMLGLPESDPRVQVLAAACVTEFDGFRAPLTDEERARRGASLTEAQKENLERWGYPHVFDDFTFHLTLAGPLPKERADDALTALSAAYSQAVKDEKFAIRSIALFAEEESGAGFRLMLRVPFGARA